jgi:poly[(R)-3-hydroxyalkanoate] polymerase subunit PhaC
VSGSQGSNAVTDRKLPAKSVPADAVPSAVDAMTKDIDRWLRGEAARFTGGLSPVGLAGAYLDWATHLASSPGKRLELGLQAARDWARFATFATRADVFAGGGVPLVEPSPGDHRFVAPEWHRWPFNVIHQAFLLQEQWWHAATSGVGGVTRQHRDAVEFAARQALDAVAPSNSVFTNPTVLQRTMESGGRNLVKGWSNFLADWRRTARGAKPAGTEAFAVGRNLAVTPGKVIFRNRLIELIQYEATAAKVRAEPILIVPAWIMKYYILDLSPQNSLVRYLTGEGFTVFMISWKNPDSSDRDLGLNDYRELGVEAALEALAAIVPGRKVHAAGYCLGGTLLTIAAATMARDKSDRLASVTLLAAETDFTEPGEIRLFINESQIDFLEDLMWQSGVLEAGQMAGTFQMLRSNDLIWSRLINDYLMGERRPLNDLMAWNADGTRMPYRMESEYLRSLFLHNDLASGHFRVGDKPIAISDIRAPIFAVGADRDHVAPWRSVFKIHLLTDTEVTFLLTSGGHNAGIVSEPGHPRRSYQVMTRSADDPYLAPDRWLATVPRQDGSWWPEWVLWLDARSSAKVAPPKIGRGAYKPLCDAPGTYVLMR